MEILINIPEEFEQEFQTYRFEDSLHRLSVDAHLLAGNYEKETARMLIFAFKNAFPVPDHGRLIDADVLRSKCDDPHWCVWMSEIDDSPTIIPASKEETDGTIS